MLNVTAGGCYHCLIKCVRLCLCEYTLFSSRLSSSEARSAGTVGLLKLAYQTGMLLLTGASLEHTVAGGKDCSDSGPAGREQGKAHNTINALKHACVCQIETMAQCRTHLRLNHIQSVFFFLLNKVCCV